MSSNENKRHYFNNHARGWERNFPPEVMDRLNDTITSLPISEGEKVLDLGCGYGILNPILKSMAGELGIVIGMDYSIEMLKYENAPFDFIYKICGDSSRIPLMDSYFDHVIAFASFPHFNDKKMVCKEVNRVLRRGGKFYVIHLLSSEEIAHHHEKAGGAVANDVLPVETKFRKMLNENGFQNITIEDMPGKYIMISEKSN